MTHRSATVLVACAAAIAARLPVHTQVAHVAVLTHHNDRARTGVNSQEHHLTPATVTSTFGRLLDFEVNGQVYAQPLYVPHLALPDGTTRNVLYVATMRNFVYAFDADAKTKAEARPLWMVGPTGLGVPVPYNFRRMAFAPAYNVHDFFGITSTPVIDLGEAAIFVVAKTLRMPQDDPHAARTRHFLYKISLTTGAVLQSVEIAAQVPGTGYGSVAGLVPFDPDLHLQRAALLAANGSVYLGFGSHQDTKKWHGWLLQYNARTLAQEHAWCVTPDGDGGAIWQAGAGPAADADGNLYVMTGNGTIATDNGRRDYSMSFVKLAPDLSVIAWFRQKGAGLANKLDLDLGASGPALAAPGVVLGGGKQGRLFLVDGRSPANGGAGTPYAMPLASSVQATPRFGPPFLIIPALGLYHIHGSPVVYHTPSATYAYIWAEKDFLRRFEVRPNKSSYEIAPKNRADAPSSKPLHAPRQGLDPVFINSMPGGILSLSANGNDIHSAIVWASMPYDDDGWIKDVRGVLRAMNAETMKQIWSNAMEPQDQQYLFAKYCPPTIANGRVFLATFSGRVLVYGATAH